MQENFKIQNNEAEKIDKLSLERSQRFLSFLRVGDFSFLKVAKDRSNDDEIGMEFGASGERGMDRWGNVLFTINIKSEEFPHLIQKEPGSMPGVPLDELPKVSHLVTKENISKAWGTCGDGKSFVFNIEKGELTVSQEEGVASMPLTAELKVDLDKALERFLKQTEGAKHQIGI
jgi:hypothetical protein